MKFSTTSVLLAAALGVSAHPSGHAHKRAHNSAVEARGDFVMANKPAEAAPTTTSAAPAASTTAAAAPSSSAPATVKPFCGGNSKRATAAEIAYKGNVGAGGSYGCNIMTVDESLVDEYQYTMVFENAGDDTTCFCWNKIGPDGGINGFFKGNQAITFDVAAGGKQVVAVDTNSQVGCACGAGGPELTPIGQFASTWVEADFGNMSNGGWSGADASSLVAAAAGMTIPGLQVCGTGAAKGTCSTIYPGGKGDNAFTAGTEALDGLGLNLAPGKTSIIVTIDYQG
ncbi:hypothetical protein MKX07_005701 [Trichoderma sp. CBMAI-0711]|jgi:hypothetical protein|uniref:Predicted protein n=3 Tax=Trichoderma TaxID=5543 RepID=G0R8F9_HYPJQ|nr:uncharacterized protein TRIREDRAFT_74060 [Trichoderma reesei QM6a]EGR52344.1 predicted protein [Trichoderma reesei QM6a]ETS06662.1 hypothetical protein M419DRAFT_121632 [Trichoderma reesei RUT C-30]KAK1251146.1 hypothetical protein MKX07_005701 [Trichoderma sp. CBMAI-0711]OTA06710.1 SSCRP protein [Trichoderma parareesei]